MCVPTSAHSLYDIVRIWLYVPFTLTLHSPTHVVAVGSLEPIPQSSFSVHVKAMHMERDSGFEREYQVRNTLFTLSTAM